MKSRSGTYKKTEIQDGGDEGHAARVVGVSVTDEQIIEVLRRGLSASGEEFRERLLARCLDALAAADTRRVGSHPERLTPVLELSDDDLGLLAAAGDPWPPASLAPRPDATRLA